MSPGDGAPVDGISPARAVLESTHARSSAMVNFQRDLSGQMAIALRNIAKSEKRTEYTRQAIIEFQEADQHYKAARNPVFRADVNNAGLLLSNLSRFREAHNVLMKPDA